MRNRIQTFEESGLFYQPPLLDYVLHASGAVYFPGLDRTGVVADYPQEAIRKAARGIITGLFDEIGFELFDRLESIKHSKQHRHNYASIDVGEISLISAVLRKIVSESSMTASEIAQRANMHGSSLSRLTNLWYKGASVPTISKILVVTGTKLDITILGGGDGETQANDS